ncbi:MAG: hypothetical protein Kow0092_11580 [Deferrisomatales bacterium]
MVDLVRLRRLRSLVARAGSSSCPARVFFNVYAPGAPWHGTTILYDPRREDWETAYRRVVAHWRRSLEMEPPR